MIKSLLLLCISITFAKTYECQPQSAKIYKTCFNEVYKECKQQKQDSCLQWAKVICTDKIFLNNKLCKEKVK